MFTCPLSGCSHGNGIDLCTHVLDVDIRCSAAAVFVGLPTLVGLSPPCLLFISLAGTYIRGKCRSVAQSICRLACLSTVLRLLCVGIRWQYDLDHKLLHLLTAATSFDKQRLGSMICHFWLRSERGVFGLDNQARQMEVIL